MSRLGVLPAWRVCVSLVVDIREPVCRVTVRSAFGFERLGCAERLGAGAARSAGRRLKLWNATVTGERCLSRREIYRVAYA